MGSINIQGMLHWSLALLLLVCGSTVRGQTWKEWLRQKKTKKEYLLAQIAALEAYGSAIKKGYAIAREGLQDIRQMKDGLSGLHQDHFRGMQVARLDSWTRARLLRVLGQYEALNNPGTGIPVLNASLGFSVDKTAYGIDRMNTIQSELKSCFASINRLLQPGVFEMPPEQRNQRIRGWLREAERHIGRLMEIRRALFELRLQREGAAMDVQSLRALYGLKISEQ